MCPLWASGTDDGRAPGSNFSVLIGTALTDTRSGSMTLDVRCGTGGLERNESSERSRRKTLDLERPFVTGGVWRSGCQTSTGASSGGVGGGGEAYSGLWGSLSGDRMRDDWNSGNWKPRDREPFACCCSCCVKLMASVTASTEDRGVDDVRLLPDFPL